MSRGLCRWVCIYWGAIISLLAWGLGRCFANMHSVALKSPHRTPEFIDWGWPSLSGVCTYPSAPASSPGTKLSPWTGPSTGDQEGSSKSHRLVSFVGLMVERLVSEPETEGPGRAGAAQR